MNYEKWSPSEKDYKGYQKRDYDGSAVGYINGRYTTIKVKLYESSMTNALAELKAICEGCSLVNWTTFCVTEKEAS
jgi:hypothetical protein